MLHCLRSVSTDGAEYDSTSALQAVLAGQSMPMPQLALVTVLLAASSLMHHGHWSLPSFLDAAHVVGECTRMRGHACRHVSTCEARIALHRSLYRCRTGARATRWLCKR